MKRVHNIKAEIILGNPQLDCARFGICQIIQDTVWKKNKLPYKHAYASLDFNLDELVLTCNFLKKSISSKTQKDFFENHLFTIEGFCFPTIIPEIVFIGTEKILHLLSGKYPLSENLYFFSTQINLALMSQNLSIKAAVHSKNNAYCEKPHLNLPQRGSLVKI
jgi:hypothetical protein